jgi:hypothetical protein
VRTVAVIEHTFMELLSDAEQRVDLASSVEATAVEVLVETINLSENDPASALPSGAQR